MVSDWLPAMLCLSQSEAISQCTYHLTTPLLMHWSYHSLTQNHHIYCWVVQERHNSIANALELRLSCTNPTICIWVKSRNCDCLVTWFCYQLIAKPGNKRAAVPWFDPFILMHVCSHPGDLPDVMATVRRQHGHGHLPCILHAVLLYTYLWWHVVRWDPRKVQVSIL